MHVLGASMLVTVIGLAAVSAVRLQIRAAQRATDDVTARACAVSAVELGLLYVTQDPNWRTTWPNGVWMSDKPLGDVTFTLEGIDPEDGDLTDSEFEPLVLTGIGMKGIARHKTQVRLVPEFRALSCLGAALHAGGNIWLAASGDTINAAGGPVSCNNQVSNQATINGDVEANSITGVGTINGTATAPAPPREMPDDATLFTYYQSIGTSISIWSLPTVSGTQTIPENYLGPDHNPYDTQVTDPNGIYVIDCQGQDLHFRNARIVGTLVLLNAGSLSRIYNSVSWEQPQSDPGTGARFPSLLVQGNIEFCFTDTALDESSLGDLNNDGDAVDTYPSVIKGLVYVSGEIVAVAAAQTCEGVVITGADFETLSNNVVHLTYDGTFFDNYPPGFGAPARMNISPSSWQQVVD